VLAAFFLFRVFSEATPRKRASEFVCVLFVGRQRELDLQCLAKRAPR